MPPLWWASAPHSLTLLPRTSPDVPLGSQAQLLPQHLPTATVLMGLMEPPLVSGWPTTSDLTSETSVMASS